MAEVKSEGECIINQVKSRHFKLHVVHWYLIRGSGRGVTSLLRELLQRWSENMVANAG